MYVCFIEMLLVNKLKKKKKRKGCVIHLYLNKLKFIGQDHSPLTRGPRPCRLRQDRFRQNFGLPHPGCRADLQAQVHAQERHRRHHPLTDTRAVDANVRSPAGTPQVSLPHLRPRHGRRQQGHRGSEAD